MYRNILNDNMSLRKIICQRYFDCLTLGFVLISDTFGTVKLSLRSWKLIPEELVTTELDLSLLELEFCNLGVEVLPLNRTACSVLLLASLIDIEETSLKSNRSPILGSTCFLFGEIILLAVFNGVMSELDDELKALASRVFFNVVIAQLRPNCLSAVSISSDEAYLSKLDDGVLVISEIPDNSQKLFELVEDTLPFSLSFLSNFVCIAFVS